MPKENYKDIVISKILSNIDEIAVVISDHIVNDFVKAIVAEEAIEQTEDPAHPLHYIDEFREFLIKDITNKDNTIRTDAGVSIHTGDGSRLGFDDELSSTDTDGIKIIGTVIQGITGEYVLVLPEQAQLMFGDKYQPSKMGRFGGAFIMLSSEYEYGKANYGWPKAPIWEFSNFPGVPNLFNNKELTNIVEKKVGEVLNTL